MPHSAVSAEWRVFFRTFGENDIRQQVITDASSVSMPFVLFITNSIYPLGKINSNIRLSCYQKRSGLSTPFHSLLVNNSPLFFQNIPWGTHKSGNAPESLYLHGCARTGGKSKWYRLHP